MARRIRVLIVDDSSLVRSVLSEELGRDSGIEVVGTAIDPYEARDKIVERQPDVLTLDVEMPRMDGVEFLRRLMPQHPLPVVMVSALTQRGKQITLEALEAGAVDFVSKPSTDVARGLKTMIMELRTKVKIASTVNVANWKSRKPGRFKVNYAQTRALAESTDKVIAIGASTGGTEAIRKILMSFPAITPGVVIVQHMPPDFTKLFAERMNKFCDMEVKEAATGDRVMNGRVLIAPGDYHMKVVRSGGIYKVVCDQGEKVSSHRPSVDVLMKSVANNAGSNALGIILTGMGSDGAKGMYSMRRAGARTLAQDEESSIVFGMPKVAYETGAAEKLIPLEEIAQATFRLLAGEAK